MGGEVDNSTVSVISRAVRLALLRTLSYQNIRMHCAVLSLILLARTIISAIVVIIIIITIIIIIVIVIIIAFIILMLERVQFDVLA